MNSKLSKGETSCAVRGCRVNAVKGETVVLYSLPSNPEMRQRWITILKDKCPSLGLKSKICSKHFERRLFDLNKKLLPTAVPNLFPASLGVSSTGDKKRLERLLNRLTNQQLIEDINDTVSMVKVPHNFADCVTDDLKCVSNTPVEAQLWLLIRKQDHLITRLKQQLNQSKKNVEVLQKNMEECRASKKAMEQNSETLKYIVKSLQEKQATLEEQIEILTSVEAR